MSKHVIRSKMEKAVGATRIDLLLAGEEVGILWSPQDEPIADELLLRWNTQPELLEALKDVIQFSSTSGEGSYAIQSARKLIAKIEGK